MAKIVLYIRGLCFARMIILLSLQSLLAVHTTWYSSNERSRGNYSYAGRTVLWFELDTMQPADSTQCFVVERSKSFLKARMTAESSDIEERPLSSSKIVQKGL